MRDTELEEQRRPPRILVPTDDILERALDQCQLFGTRPVQESTGDLCAGTGNSTNSAAPRSSQPANKKPTKACKKRKSPKQTEAAKAKAKKIKEQAANSGSNNLSPEQAASLCKEVICAWYERRAAQYINVVSKMMHIIDRELTLKFAIRDLKASQQRTFTHAAVVAFAGKAIAALAMSSQ